MNDAQKVFACCTEQARQGQGLCSPNPAVGAVAVQNGTIIAQAYHKGAGTPHAEPLVLAQLPPKMPGVSLYVSLEPCNHWGRTPPCVDAIIDYGIEEVIFAYSDPNPVVANRNSTEMLRAQRIKVIHYPVEEITEFYKSYTYWTLTKKPKITAKITQTLNGKIGHRVGERVLLTNSLCEQFTHRHRAATDIILTTAKTIQHDNPQLNVRLKDQVQAKPVAIIDQNLVLDKNAVIFSTARHCHIFYCIEREEQKTSYSNSTFHLMPKQNGAMDLHAIISHLGALGYHDVWVEAGGALFSSLHQEGLVHRTYILENNAISAYQKSGLFDRRHTLFWQTMGDNMIAVMDWLDEKK